MAHYAFIDENNLVTEVIPGKDESDTSENWELHYAQFREGMRCIRTSYNTFKGAHKDGGTPFRKNFAGVGYTYDEGRDAFIAPKPFPSWILNEETCSWNSPIPMPTDGKRYRWDEPTISWIEIEISA
jgi:hypothetical protein